MPRATSALRIIFTNLSFLPDAHVTLFEPGRGGVVGRCFGNGRTELVGLARIELATSSLSGMRSNRLSYSPS